MGLIAWARSAVGLSPRIAERALARRSGPRLIVGTLPLSLQLQRIGGGLTPQQVSSIIRDADSGYMWRLIDLGNEARQKDCHLQSVLYTRESALAGLDWEVRPSKKPGRKEPLAKDRRIAEFTEAAIRQAVVPYESHELCGFPDLVAHLNGAVFPGYAVSEIDWKKDGASIVPRGFSRISARRFRFNIESGRLEWWDQGFGMAEGVDFAEKYPGKFICHKPRINGDVPCREGLIRVLMWAALFRNWDIRDWLSLAELAWKPWRTGKYQKAASQEDIDNLESVLESLTTSGVATYPETTELEIHFPSGNAGTNATHQELANFMAAEMSKAVLGQTLTTEAGTRGARSLGDVHDEVRKDIREADAMAVAATIRRDLIVPLVRMNFGPTAAIPDFQFITEESADLKAFGEGVKNLFDAGTKIPQSWVRDQAGIPEPEEGEELLGAQEVDVSEFDATKPNKPSTDPEAVADEAEAEPAAEPEPEPQAAQ